MATASIVRGDTFTLSSTTEDVITITQPWPAIEITNHDTDTPLYVRFDNIAAVAEAEGASVIPGGATKVFRASVIPGTNTHIVRLLGDGGKYTVEGVQ